jgi:hypothetical protein
VTFHLPAIKLLAVFYTSFLSDRSLQRRLIITDQENKLKILSTSRKDRFDLILLNKPNGYYPLTLSPNLPEHLKVTTFLGPASKLSFGIWGWATLTNYNNSDDSFWPQKGPFKAFFNAKFERFAYYINVLLWPDPRSFPEVIGYFWASITTNPLVNLVHETDSEGRVFSDRS